MSEPALPFPVTTPQTPTPRSSVSSDGTLVNDHHEKPPPTQKPRHYCLNFCQCIEILPILFWELGGRVLAYLGLQVLMDMIFVPTGHAILRATRPGYSVPLVSSMRAGAVGGAVIGVPIVSLELLYRRLMYGSAEERKNATGDKQGTSCWSYISERLKRLVRSTCDGTLVALVGFCILRAAGYEGMLDPLHAVRVGAVGGVVICGSIMSIEWVAIALWCPIAACFCW